MSKMPIAPLFTVDGNLMLATVLAPFTGIEVLNRSVVSGRVPPLPVSWGDMLATTVSPGAAGPLPPPSAQSVSVSVPVDVEPSVEGTVTGAVDGDGPAGAAVPTHPISVAPALAANGIVWPAGEIASGVLGAALGQV